MRRVMRRGNILAAFPKFILASAALIGIGGSYDFFKFYQAMKRAGPGSYCSPRHRMLFNSRNEGLQCV